jgi:hypothetical protein
VNAVPSIASSVALWGTAVALCYGIKAVVPVPALVQILFGAVVFAGTALIHVRGPILCVSDRDLLLRLFQGKETKILRVLGLLNSDAEASGAR